MHFTKLTEQNYCDSIVTLNEVIEVLVNMWIIRKEYERLMYIANRNPKTEETALCYIDLYFKSQELIQRDAKTIKELKDQIEKYKQKYADELQKRLELAEMIGNNERS